jgi:eukaryotic-like serine/threonine-protein kinase
VALAIGSRVGPYEILALLGAGGMGEVWKARDTRLDRIVAIKCLTRHSERFEQEARAIAALNHPHICQIYDVGPDYLVLEYVEGAPLRGPLPVADALRLAIQIASALEEAHARGILHRDLKPANVIVTARGTAKLLDFGLAKLVSADADATRTLDGNIVGTAAYMSPEQAHGHPIDARSDVFSFGAVLYEMLSGCRAFGGTSVVDVLSAVIRTEPQSIRTPSALDPIVRRCLAKPAGERFQTMADVKAALEHASRDMATKPAPQRASIAVLPFANMSGDKENEYFSDGLAEEIINALAQIPDLKVIARTSAFAFKDKQEDVRRIAETLGVLNILEGSVRRAGNRVRVTAQLIAAADGSHLWSNRYDREMTDVFAIQDEIAQAIAGALQVKLAPVRTGQRHTPTLPAYEALLRGRHQFFRFTKESWARGIECFKQAIELDAEYAQPHAELGLAYLMAATNGAWPLRDVASLVRSEAQHALDLSPSEQGPNFLLGSIAAAVDYDWGEASTRFRAALANTPVAPDIRWAYASFYLQPLGRFSEAVAEMQREVDHDPLNVMYRAVVASHMTHAGMYDQAIENAMKAIEIDPGHWVAHFTLGEAYASAGRFGAAVNATERAHEIAPWHAMATGLLAGALARVGEKVRADELARHIGGANLAVGRALYHLMCPDVDAAADWYEKMIEQRDPFAVIFADGPLFRPLRESPRWRKLAQMMKLPQ